jgi:hypothetical protein
MSRYETVIEGDDKDIQKSLLRDKSLARGFLYLASINFYPRGNQLFDIAEGRL